MNHILRYSTVLLISLSALSCISQQASNRRSVVKHVSPNSVIKGSVIAFDSVIAMLKSYEGAYPGAQGGGASTTGGKGGKVIYVTSLDDDSKLPGTLRWAINQSGPRTIVFSVGGTIQLKSILKINKGDLTIAGQTAPGDGICIRNFPMTVSADNVVIQFLRFRMGDEAGEADDALKGMGRKNILIDHCSMSWGTDECSSFYDNENFTMQWCILSESLRNSVHAKGSHGYGGIWGGKNATFHHNLLAHHDSRNPRFCGSRYSNDSASEKVDFRNNVIYNWASNSMYAGEGGKYNIVNNYYKPGPATLSGRGKHTYRIFAPNSDAGTNRQAKGVWGSFYVAGNVMHNRPDITANNSLGIHPDLKNDEFRTPEDLCVNKEFSFALMPYHTAEEAYQRVLAKAGASSVRDKVDQRIVKEVEESTFTYSGSRGSTNGIIDSQTDVGGWPVYGYSQQEVPVDTDADGIPDLWESKQGLDPGNPADAAKVMNDSVYTWLEAYLFSLVAHLY